MTENLVERKKKEICDAFDYLKHMAINALTEHQTTEMFFTLKAAPGCAITVSHDITEYLLSEDDK